MVIDDIIAKVFLANGVPAERVKDIVVVQNDRLKVTAGLACHRPKGEYINGRLWHHIIKLSGPLMARMSAAELEQTVAHEAAHIVDHIKKGHSDHGRDWQYNMIRAGYKPERCHNLNIEGLVKRHKIYCRVHGELSCGPKVYKKIQMGYGYRCAKCKCKLALTPNEASCIKS